jgi:hypothetical protein
MKKRIIDKRRKEKFMLDDEYLNGQAKLCGWKGTIVYNSLCRHSDKEQHCFPSIKLMSEQHGVGRNTILKGIETLKNRNIISIERTRNKGGKWLNNSYTLLDKSEWDYNQVPLKDTVNQVPLRTSPSPSQNITKSSTRTLRKHREGNTEKETHISKTEFCDNTNYLIGLFKPVNILFDSLYRNKTERSAIQELEKKVTLKKLEGIINVLPVTNNETFCPTITKPTELRRDISKLIAFVHANKGNFNKTNRKA